jgi:hypothetical protein
MMQGIVIVLAFAAAPPVVAEGMRYELFPDSGDVQVCDIRHAGLCVKIGLP